MSFGYTEKTWSGTPEDLSWWIARHRTSGFSNIHEDGSIVIGYADGTSARCRVGDMLTHVQGGPVRVVRGG